MLATATEESVLATHTRIPDSSIVRSLALSILMLAAQSATAATITVTTTADNAIAADGECTLREAIINANGGTDESGGDCPAGSNGRDEVRFSSGLTGATIALDGTQFPQIEDSIGIAGPDPTDSDSLTLDGGRQSRIFDLLVFFGEVELSGMTLANGVTQLDYESGGGIRSDFTDVTLRNVAVRGCATMGTGSRGGGINVLRGRLTLIDSSVMENATWGDDADGGGLLNASSASGLELINSTVSGNATFGESAHGGGIFMHRAPIGIKNSTISGNRIEGASSHGGAIHLQGRFQHFQQPANAEIVHSTIAFNRNASSTGSIYTAESSENLRNFISINNSIIAPSVGLACNRPIDSGTRNLVADGSCTGTQIPITAIGLQPLADNGGPTLSHALTLESIAINAAADCVTDHGITQDQRGISRPLSDACDIGSIEIAASIPVSVGNWPTWLIMLFAITILAVWRQCSTA